MGPASLAPNHPCQKNSPNSQLEQGETDNFVVTVARSSRFDSLFARCRFCSSCDDSATQCFTVFKFLIKLKFLSIIVDRCTLSNSHCLHLNSDSSLGVTESKSIISFITGASIRLSAFGSNLAKSDQSKAWRTSILQCCTHYCWGKINCSLLNPILVTRIGVQTVIGTLFWV